MLYVTQINNLKENIPNQLAIVRSLKNSKPGIIQVPELSPSWELFQEYLKLKNQGDWDTQTFESIYVPWFLREIAENKGNSRDKLNWLWKLATTQDVTVACFCTDEELCHRSIVAGLIQGVGGVKVITDSGNDYSCYYHMYLELRGRATAQ